jgi:L-lactate dehydrogenase (cytochrome)
MVSSNASLSFEAIMDAAAPSQPLFFQLYKNRRDNLAEERITEVIRLGYRAIFLTVDAIVPGNREADIRSPWVLQDQESGTSPVWDENAPEEDVNLGGTAGALVDRDDQDMTWEKVSDIIVAGKVNVLVMSPASRPFPGFVAKPSYP